MENPTQLFIVMVAAGLLLMVLEVIIPGGVLGIFGGLALLTAIITSFFAFGSTGGLIAAASIVVVVGLVLAIWIAIFPKTVAGKILTLSSDTKDYKSTPNEQTELLDKEGLTLTTLHPAGVAKIEGQRVDVIADGEYIEKGATVRVIEVQGARIAVRETKPS